VFQKNIIEMCLVLCISSAHLSALITMEFIQDVNGSIHRSIECL